MTAYNDHLYSFLTQTENFEPFLNLTDEYEMVRKRLIEDFWQEVLVQAIALQSSVDPWVFSLDAEGANNRKLRATHPDIKTSEAYPAGIVFENLDNWVQLGAWFNRTIFKENIAPILEDAQRFHENNTSWHAGNNSSYFMLHTRPDLDFRKKSELLQITPEKRGAIAATYAEILVKAVVDLGNFCLKHAKKS